MIAATFATDDQLMTLAATGDGEAFGQIVERYQAQLVGFVNRQLRDLQKAEDIAQETFMRVYAKSSAYLPRGEFSGWLYRIARNMIVDDSRRQNGDMIGKALSTDWVYQNENVIQLESDSPAIGDSLESAEMSEWIGEYLDRLPEEQRMTFILNVCVGLSLPEVAEAMETSLPTTKSRLRLAKEKIRDYLKCRGIDDPVCEKCVA